MRVFTSDQGPLRNKSEKKDPTVAANPVHANTPSQLENANIVQKPKESGETKTPPPKKDLLSEPMAASKEQRKADWAIMKEMAKYLWPKVLPTWYWYKVRVLTIAVRTIGVRNFVSARHCHF